MNKKRESTIQQACRVMSSNKQDPKIPLDKEVDLVREALEDSQASRASMINSDRVDSKAKQEQAIHSATYSRNSRNSSVDSKVEEEAEEHKRR